MEIKISIAPDARRLPVEDSWYNAEADIIIKTESGDAVLNETSIPIIQLDHELQMWRQSGQLRFCFSPDSYACNPLLVLVNFGSYYIAEGATTSKPQVLLSTDEVETLISAVHKSALELR